CRDGIDPLTNQPYSNHDCAPPVGDANTYSCENGQCVVQNCVQQGGAQLGGTDQLCCGEDRDHPGYLDSGFADTTHAANECPPGIDAGQYYVAPAPPWCHTGCTQDLTGPLPDGGTLNNTLYTCSTDDGVPSFDPLGSPGICLTYAPGQPPDC